MNTKLVEVVTVADVDAEDNVGNSLLQIWELRFGPKDCHNRSGDAYVLYTAATPQTTYMASTGLNSSEIVVLLDLFILIDTTKMLPTSYRQPKVSSKDVI